LQDWPDIRKVGTYLTNLSKYHHITNYQQHLDKLMVGVRITRSMSLHCV